MAIDNRPEEEDRWMDEETKSLRAPIQYLKLAVDAAKRGYKSVMQDSLNLYFNERNFPSDIVARVTNAVNGIYMKNHQERLQLKVREDITFAINPSIANGKEYAEKAIRDLKELFSLK
ncbi:MAG TPA: hypothetical protein VMC80_02785 [Patescibacteria group bacterium]|nr:hypothetical protein [Patescibacteria group bacterium]